MFSEEILNRSALFLAIFVLLDIFGSSEAVPDHTKAVDCSPDVCSADQFCDSIEKRCSKCSEAICDLGERPECRLFCLSHVNRRENRTTDAEGWRTVLDHVRISNSRTVTMLSAMLLGLAFVIVMSAAMLILLIRRKQLLAHLSYKEDMESPKLSPYNIASLPVEKSLNKDPVYVKTLNNCVANTVTCSCEPGSVRFPVERSTRCPEEPLGEEGSLLPERPCQPSPLRL